MLFTHIVKTHEANQRLDHFLMKKSSLARYPIVSRNECAMVIKKGLVLVNEIEAKPSHTIKTGDVLTFVDLPETKKEFVPANPNLPIKILFQNEFFIILDKPAGIAMHPAHIEDTETVANWLVAQYPDIIKVGEDALRPGVVHRLDKNTSGICVAAKTQEVFMEFKAMFKQRTIQKTYAAVVYGHIEPKEGIITKPIARSLTLHKQVIVDNELKAKGKIRDAVTHYTVMQSADNFDFVEAQPKTGRMHQIRVHFGSLGHPVVGDKLYGTKLTRKADQLLTPAPTRHLLHAKRLEFDLFGEHYDFSSPVPQDFQHFFGMSE